MNKINSVKNRVVFAGCIFLVLACSKPKMRFEREYDKSANFSSFKTYTWDPLFKPDTTLFKPEVHLMLESTVEKELQKIGYQKSLKPKEADFYVRYWLSKKDRTQTVHKHPAPGEGEFVERKFPEGTFILDFNHPKDNKLLWRGWVQAEIHPDVPEEKRKERATSALKELLGEFPPK